MTNIAIHDLTGSTPGALFEDTAGTTAATTVVGKARDLSGNGNHLFATNDTGVKSASFAPDLIDGGVAFTNYTGHRLATEPLSSPADKTSILLAVSFAQVSAINVFGHGLLEFGTATSRLREIAADGGDDRFKIIGGTDIDSSGEDFAAVTTDGAKHTLIIYTNDGIEWFARRDGAAAVSAGTNDIRSAGDLLRFSVGARFPDREPRAWNGNVYRHGIATDFDNAEIDAFQAWLDGGSAPGVGPTTNEELFQASYADASAALPKITALIRPADVQRSIDTDVSNLKDGPNFYTVEAIFDLGKLENLNPYNSATGKPRVFFVKDDQPGLRQGKNLLLKGYQIRSADPSVPVTCTFWGY